MHKSIWIVLSTIYSFSFSQKIDYKKFTEVLCSSEFHGRGYVNQGDSLAANYIAQTFSQIGILPLANSSEDYFQSFSFPVNTFPRDLSVQLNSKVLTPGIHFLVDPASSSFSGTLNLNSISITDLYNQQTRLRSIRSTRQVLVM